MNERTEEFLERFKDFDNNDIKVIFGNIFSEFIEVLNDVDLSEKTLIYLNEIFEKDMFLFFEKLIKNYVDKFLVNKVINKYYMEYEKQKEYRFTDDVEEEQEILLQIRKEIIE